LSSVSYQSAACPCDREADKGIGLHTECFLLTGISALGSMDKGQIAKLVGVAPLNRLRDQMRGKRMISGGRKTVRDARYIAALPAVRFEPDIENANLRATRKQAKSLFAVMRKMIIRNAKRAVMLRRCWTRDTVKFPLRQKNQPQVARETNPVAGSVSIVTRSSLKSWVNMSPGWIWRTVLAPVSCIASASVGLSLPTSPCAASELHGPAAGKVAIPSALHPDMTKAMPAKSIGTKYGGNFIETSLL
jgi:hypothetical protein